MERLLEELEGYVKEASLPANHLGFAVPMELESRHGLLKLITTLSAFTTATDVVLSEIRLEAFLPADDLTTERLFQRAARDEAS